MQLLKKKYTYILVILIGLLYFFGKPDMLFLAPMRNMNCFIRFKKAMSFYG